MDSKILNTRKNELLDAQTKMLAAAQEAKVKLTDVQETQFNDAVAEIHDIDTNLARMAAIAKGKGEVGAPTSDLFIAQESRTTKSGKRIFSAEYHKAFWNSIQERKFSNAALNEGTSSEGGFTVPVVVEDQIIPLAPLESSMRKLALVLTTENDIKFPQQATRTTAAQKTESGDTSYSFGGTNPSFSQFTLTAYTNGVNVPISIELAADVDAMAPFVTMDLSRGIANWEEQMFISGTGSGQPQGVLGNTSGTITESLTTYGVDAVLDLTGEVNPFYYANASFLMNRLTGIQFQKAQLALNQFQSFWSRTGTQDYLLGYPVEYSYEMPVFASLSPVTLGSIIFGDFKSGYVIGDRHTSAITARVLTEVGALQGIINILGYRRSDGKVRRSEALAQLNVNG
jgi:HK97 family phage major capsid protein